MPTNAKRATPTPVAPPANRISVANRTRRSITGSFGRGSDTAVGYRRDRIEGTGAGAERGNRRGRRLKPGWSEQRPSAATVDYSSVLTWSARSSPTSLRSAAGSALPVRVHQVRRAVAVAVDGLEIVDETVDISVGPLVGPAGHRDLLVDVVLDEAVANARLGTIGVSGSVGGDRRVIEPALDDGNELLDVGPDARLRREVVGPDSGEGCADGATPCVSDDREHVRVGVSERVGDAAGEDALAVDDVAHAITDVTGGKKESRAVARPHPLLRDAGVGTAN